MHNERLFVQNSAQVISPSVEYSQHVHTGLGNTEIKEESVTGAQKTSATPNPLHTKGIVKFFGAVGY